MKNLIKTLVIGLFIVGLANCGSKGGGGTAPATPKVSLAGAADRIVIDDQNSAGPVYWSSALANMYYQVSADGRCMTGLAADADDNVVQERMDRLQSLLNAANATPGTGEFQGDTRFVPSVSVRAGGKLETYYLVPRDEAPSTVKTLSNYEDILDFYDDTVTELNNNGRYYCPGKGKGSDTPEQY